MAGERVKDGLEATSNGTVVFSSYKRGRAAPDWGGCLVWG